MTPRQGPQARNGRIFRRLLVTVLCLTIATHATRLMVTYRALELGADPFELGLMASAFALLSLIFALPLGRSVDRWGERRFIIGGVAAIATATTSMIWLNTLWALAIGLALLGLGQTTAVVANQSFVAALDDGRPSDARFGYFAAVVSIGHLVGPALGGAVAGLAHGNTPDIVTTLVVSGAIAAIGTLAACLIGLPEEGGRVETPAASDVPRGTRRDMSRILETPGMSRAIVVSMAVLSSIDIIAVYLPALGEARGLSVETVGLLLSARAGASLLSRVGMARLLRWAGRRRILIASVALPALALAVLPFAPWVWLLFLLMVCIGLGLGLGQPITLAWVATSVPRDLRATALSIRLGSNRFAQVAFPGAVAVVAGALGASSAFLCLAVVLAGSGLAIAQAPLDKPDHEA